TALTGQTKTPALGPAFSFCRRGGSQSPLCPGLSRASTSSFIVAAKTWMAGARPGMTGIERDQLLQRSRRGRAADIDHVAVAGAGVLVDEAGDHHAAVEGDDLAVLLSGRRAGRADIVLAAR